MIQPVIIAVTGREGYAELIHILYFVLFYLTQSLSAIIHRIVIAAPGAADMVIQRVVFQHPRQEIRPGTSYRSQRHVASGYPAIENSHKTGDAAFSSRFID